LKYLVDSHSHTIVSGHAYSTRMEMIQAAKTKGLEALALTEHAPKMPGTCHEFYFQNYPVVPRTVDGLHIFMGAELNILDELGTVDLPDLYYSPWILPLQVSTDLVIVRIPKLSKKGVGI